MDITLLALCTVVTENILNECKKNPWVNIVNMFILLISVYISDIVVMVSVSLASGLDPSHSVILIWSPSLNTWLQPCFQSVISALSYSLSD